MLTCHAVQNLEDAIIWTDVNPQLVLLGAVSSLCLFVLSRNEGSSNHKK